MRGVTGEGRGGLFSPSLRHRGTPLDRMSLLVLLSHKAHLSPTAVNQQPTDSCRLSPVTSTSEGGGGGRKRKRKKNLLSVIFPTNLLAESLQKRRSPQEAGQLDTADLNQVCWCVYSTHPNI